MSEIVEEVEVNLNLNLRTPSNQIKTTKLKYNSNFKLRDNILIVKEFIQSNFDGKPSLNGIILVLGGRVLNDNDTLIDILKDIKIDDESDGKVPSYEIHVMIKSSAWNWTPEELASSNPLNTTTATPALATSIETPILTTPTATTSNSTITPIPSIPVPTRSSTRPIPTRTTIPGYSVRYIIPAPIYDPSLPTADNSSTINSSNSTSDSTTLPTPSSIPAIPSLSNKRSTTSGYPTYLAFVAQLIPLQRSLLVLNLQKAHYFYSLEIQARLIKLGWSESTNEIENHQINIKVNLEKGLDETEESFEERKVIEKKRLEQEFEEGLGEVKEIKDLLVECGLWPLVEEKELEAEKEVENWTAGVGQVDEQGEFQVVQISGLPFILHMPVNYLDAPKSIAPSLPLYKSLKRAQAILHILTTMLQLLITYQPSSPSVAYGRSSVRAHSSSSLPNAAAGAGLGANFDDVPGRVRAVNDPIAIPIEVAVAAGIIPPVPVRPVRRATLSIVINLEAIVSILVPLFFLSLKLGFLLWIFGRHASQTKKYILFGLAGFWILWEAWTLLRRRSAGARERERERRRVANGGLPGLQPVGIPAADRRGEGENRRVGRRGVEVPEVAGAGGAVPRVRAIASRLTPRYWLNYIAAIGLADEARELGLVPRSIAGRPVTNPAPQYQRISPGDRIGLAAQSRRRAFRTALVAIVLFFGTLSPEVERKRKRALDKRDKLLALRQVNRMKKALAAAALKAQEDAEKKLNGTQDEQDEDAKEKPTASTSTSNYPNEKSPASTSASGAAAIGRQLIPDKELFSDGTAEPEQIINNNENLDSGGEIEEGITEAQRIRHLAVVEGRVEEDSDEELERIAERDREERERQEAVPLF